MVRDKRSCLRGSKQGRRKFENTTPDSEGGRSNLDVTSRLKGNIHGGPKKGGLLEIRIYSREQVQPDSNLC